MYRISVFLLVFSFFTLNASSVFLVNDSPYPLTAVVQTADGKTIGTVSLKPGEQSNWSTDFDRTDVDDVFDSSVSITPYSVVWKCSYEGYYSVCTNVSPGATVSSSGCDGAKTCNPKPKKPKCVPCCPPDEEKDQ